MADKNTKKYYYRYPLAIYIIYALFGIILLACAIFNLLKTLEVGDLVSYYKGLEICAILLPLLALAGITFFLFSNCYIVGEGKFIYKKIFKKEYPAEKLLTIKEDKTSGLVVLYVEDETKEDFIGFVVLQVSKSRKDELISDIQKINPHVSVEVIKGKKE